MPQVVDEPVSLVDLGPTILDIFGLETPGDAMGQSLVPYLRGDRPVLMRPIVAEGLQKQAMVFPSGLKVIRDNRSKTIEIYDLEKDPDEVVNLSDTIDLSTSPEYSRFFHFFEAHTYREDGYVHPRR
ncbi:MAG: hypothetical protein JKY37_13695 [Nannocystaceae bacterium]|nr:hypothetical protein [Nannocystaceae bacterium]